MGWGWEVRMEGAVWRRQKASKETSQGSALRNKAVNKGNTVKGQYTVSQGLGKQSLSMVPGGVNRHEEKGRGGCSTVKAMGINMDE